ncbi:MAG: hypothetical protein K2N73_01460 [Lachnospiraceae bacterium]|nr:hypothetical protein [Lachnospiraceae bacterium]
MYRFRTGLRKIILCCLALSLCLSVSACANRKQPPADRQPANDSAAADGTHQDEPAQEKGFGSVIASYGVEAPVSRPAIYVDMAGYVVGREKKVVFAGGQYGKVFQVVRSQDGVVMYTGKIPESTEDKLTGQQFSVTDFTPLDEPGTYYIHTDVVGQSYPFCIAEDTYENLFLNMLKNASAVSMEESAQGVCNAAFGMHVIMYALQCNGTLFESAYEHLGEDEQLVTQLLYVGKWMISQQHQDGSLYDDYEATAAFCGIMAMSRDMFGRYESSVDKEYMDAATRAWEWLERRSCSTEGEKNAQFYAAAQLFHEEGSVQYKTIAEKFLKEKEKNYSDGRFVFYGVLAYLSAKKGTDRDLCTYIMKDLMSRTEDICEYAEADTIFGVGGRTAEEIVNHALHLSFINYLTPSKEYTLIIENTIQYMGGLNESGTCYIGSDGIWKNTDAAQETNLEWNGIMLLSMSDMLKNINGYATDNEIISE